jgi:hypothetical protein
MNDRRSGARPAMIMAIVAGLLLAIGAPAPASASGNGWEQREFPAGYIDAMASSEDGIVAGGQSGIWFSDDGRAWEQVLGREEFPEPGPSPQTGGIRDMAVGGPGFVAVGQALPEGGDRVEAAVWTSPDGRSWTRQEGPVFSEGTEPIPDHVSTTRSSIAGVASGEAGLVAVGEIFTGKFVDGQLLPDGFTPVVWKSPDGEQWSRHRIAEGRGAGPASLSDVTATRNGFLTIGSDGGHPSVWRSRDGVTWKQLPLDPGSDHPGAVSVAHGRIVAVGTTADWDRAAIWTLGKRGRWKLRASAQPASVTNFSDVAGTPDGFVAVGWRGESGIAVDPLLWTSPDGRTWRAVRQRDRPSAARTHLTAVGATEREFLALGQTASGSGTIDDSVELHGVMWARSR